MNDVRFFKIRHVPTGLYYKPSKHRSKENLSVKGKVYERRPPLPTVGDTYRHPLPDGDHEHRKVLAADWVIIEFRMVEAAPETKPDFKNSAVAEARAFTAKASFVECPHCDHLTSLGEEVVFDVDPYEDSCEACGGRIKIVPPKAER